MRISVLPGDKGYPPNGMYDVYFNGKRLVNCYTADDVLGEVVVYDVESPALFPDEIPMRILRGRVSIEKLR